MCFVQGTHVLNRVIQFSEGLWIWYLPFLTAFPFARKVCFHLACGGLASFQALPVEAHRALRVPVHADRLDSTPFTTPVLFLLYGDDRRVWCLASPAKTHTIFVERVSGCLYTWYIRREDENWWKGCCWRQSKNQYIWLSSRLLANGSRFRVLWSDHINHWALCFPRRVRFWFYWSPCWWMAFVGVLVIA